MRSITYVLCRKKSSAWGPIRSQFGEHVGPHQHAQHNLQWWRTCTEGRRWLPSRGNGDWRRSAHESDQATVDGTNRQRSTVADHGRTLKHMLPCSPPHTGAQRSTPWPYHSGARWSDAVLSVCRKAAWNGRIADGTTPKSKNSTTRW